MTIEPILKKVRVSLPKDKAFELFTTHMGSWWPVESHSVSAGQGAPSQAIEFTCGIGGGIVEVGSDGARHDWGKVEAWNEGEAFTMTWHPGTNPDTPTRLHVQFETDGDGTMVTLTHTDWEVLGTEAAKSRDGYNGGWDGVLARLVAAA